MGCALRQWSSASIKVLALADTILPAERGTNMRRREFITLLGSAAAWVSPAGAQEPRKVIGFLGGSSSDTYPGRLAAFIQGLKDTGFIEGKDISIEWRWAEGQ